ncbi:MAG: hypothetical protein ACPL1F_05665, partial [bacterium]
NLESKNKEINIYKASDGTEKLDIENMIENPRPDYMGRIHMVIKDKETGAIFELQIGSKNITDFIEKPVNINYGTKEQINKNGTITYIEDTFNSNIHDLCYKVINKIIDNPNYNNKYKNLIPKLQTLKEEYINIQKEIFESEKNGTFESKKQQIQNRINKYVYNLQNTFVNIDKNDIQTLLG